SVAKPVVHTPEAGDFVIEAIERLRATPAQIKRRIVETAQTDGPSVHVWIEQEPGAAGVAVVDDLARSLPGYVVRGDRPTGDKETRATLVAAAAENGLVWIVDGAYVEAFVDECEAFPNGEHDDQVDVLSGAHGKVAQAGPMRSSR